MWISLPILVWLLSVGWLHRRPLPLRLALLYATTAMGVLVALLTETLSLMGLLSRPVVVGVWMALLAALFALHRRWPGRSRPSLPRRFRRAGGGSVALLLMLVLGLTGLTAWSSAPNNWDSMTYHLPRVMHWRAQQSVRHYPTAITRQLYQPPGAEYGLLQLALLTEGDRAFNLLQWAALVLSLPALSWCTKRLGGTPAAQQLTLALAATVPMAILQASNTKNGLVLTLWLAIAAALLLETQHGPSRRRAGWAWLGATGALGLAWLTHGLAYLLSLPALALWAWLGWRQWRRQRRGQRVVLGVVLLAALILPHWGRNIQTFGSPLGPERESYVNNPPSLGGTASNVVRNLTLHLATSNRAWNERVVQAVTQLHAALGLEVNDPATTYFACRWALSTRITNEDYAPAPGHVLLALAALAAALLLRRPAAERGQRQVYAMVLLLMMLGFCALLKWQVWHCRLHLPLLMLAQPLGAWAVTRWWGRRGAWVVSLILLAWAGPSLIANETRPLVGAQSVFATPRLEQYFNARPALEPGYREALALLTAQQVSAIGLFAGPDSYEYPLWLLGTPARPVRVHHVLPVHPTNAQTHPVWPRWMVALDRVVSVPVVLGGRTYQAVGGAAPVMILHVQDDLADPACPGGG